MTEIVYILTSILMSTLIVVGFYISRKKHLNEKRKSLSQTVKIAFSIVCMFIYLFILSNNNVLVDYGMPPRFPIFLVVPFFTFCILFFIRNRQNGYIQSIPLHWTIFYQSFRIIAELLLLSTFLKGIIPVEATFEGFNFDIAIGISALVLGFLVLKTGEKYKTLLRFWNILGIVMILIVAMIIATNIYQPQIWGYDNPSVQKEFVQLPYLLIPGFLAPSAIFIHLLSLIQLNKPNE